MVQSSPRSDQPLGDRLQSDLKNDLIAGLLVVIPLVAYAIDRLLWWLQCDLFPHRYGGRGLLPRFSRGLLHGTSSRAKEAA